MRGAGQPDTLSDTRLQVRIQIRLLRPYRIDVVSFVSRDNVEMQMKYRLLGRSSGRTDEIHAGWRHCAPNRAPYPNYAIHEVRAKARTK